MNQSVAERPGKVRTVTSLMKQLLLEVRVEPVGIAARLRVAEIHARSVSGIERGLARNVVDELEGMTLPFCGQERSNPMSGAAAGRRPSRVDRLLDDIEAAQFDQQRQRNATLAAVRPESWGQEVLGEMSAGTTL